MKKKNLANFIINIIFTVSIGILSFTSNMYFGKNLGKETLGLMKLFTQLVAYLNLVELGIGTAASYSLYKPLVNKDNEKVSIIVNTISHIYKIISLLVLLIGLSLNVLLPFILSSNIFGSKVYIYWSLYVVNLAISYNYLKYIAIFTANQEYRFIRVVQGASKVIFLIIQIYAIIHFKSFLLYIICISIENFVNYYYFSKHFKKNYLFIKNTNRRDNSIFKDMKKLFWHQLGGAVVNNTDYIILSKYTSFSVIAGYSSYLMISQMILVISNLGTPVITPLIGKLIAEKSNEEVYGTWKKFQVVYTYLSIVVCITTYYLIDNFIQLWMGEEYLLSKSATFFIVLNLFFNILKRILDVFKNNSGYFDDIYNPIIESAVNLLISLILVKKIGVLGVVIGTVCSNFLVIYILKPSLVYKNCFNKSISRYFLDLIEILPILILTVIFITLIKNNFLAPVEDLNLKIFVVHSIKVLFTVVITSSLLFLINKEFKIIIKNCFVRINFRKRILYGREN